MLIKKFTERYESILCNFYNFVIILNLVLNNSQILHSTLIFLILNVIQIAILLFLFQEVRQVKLLLSVIL